MSWWAVDVRAAPARREWVGAWLVARTGHAVEERVVVEARRQLER